MKEPLISIIIPVYNGEKYIENICDDLANQTYKNYEAIFVNDGSTDDSLRILKRINKKNYIIITQSNKGVSYARNEGLKYARGEYVTFVDVDDGLHPNYLEVLLSYTYKNKDTISFCKLSNKKMKINLTNIKVVKYTKNEALKNFLYGKFHTGVCGMLIPKKILMDNSLQFKVGFKYSEDLHMVWRIINNASEINQINLPIYIYKENEESAMTKMNKDRFDSIKLMIDLEEYFFYKNKDFYSDFKHFAVARSAWSLLWQAAHYLDKKEFNEFCNYFDFCNELSKLKVFPDKKVAILSKIFLINQSIYYFIIKIITFRYRKK